MITNKSHRVVSSLILALASITSACGASDISMRPKTSDDGATASEFAISSLPEDVAAKYPPEMLDASAQWPSPGRDYSNSRYTTQSRISSKNLESLEAVGTVQTPGQGGYGNLSTTPLIIGEVGYVQDLASNVTAFDVATGATLWKHTYDLFQIGPNGVSAGYGRLYVAKGSEEVASLDISTGDELWTTKIINTASTGISIQPQVADSKVFVASIPISTRGIYTPGDRGIIYALDAKTGEVVWEFDTIKDPDFWGHPEINSGGGSWGPPTVDPQRSSVYFAVANPAPFPGTPEFPNGSSRPGDNLFTESIVSLDITTGELKWYHQVKPHDIFDLDMLYTMLYHGNDPGGSDDILVATGKNGLIVGIDPDTGDELYRTPVGKHLNDDLEELSQETLIYPGTYGGVISPPALADGIVYAAVLNAPSHLKPDEAHYEGSEFGTEPGEVVAVDARTGAQLWSTKVDGDPFGGTIVVNDLVFTATFQAQIYALDRYSGRILRVIEAPGGINGWAAASGSELLWPVGMANPGQVVIYAPK